MQYIPFGKQSVHIKRSTFELVEISNVTCTATSIS